MDDNFDMYAYFDGLDENEDEGKAQRDFLEQVNQYQEIQDGESANSKDEKSDITVNDMFKTSKDERDMLDDEELQNLCMSTFSKGVSLQSALQVGTIGEDLKEESFDSIDDISDGLEDEPWSFMQEKQVREVNGVDSLVNMSLIHLSAPTRPY